MGQDRNFPSARDRRLARAGSVASARAVQGYTFEERLQRRIFRCRLNVLGICEQFSIEDERPANRYGVGL
ncbi:hypothetical protein A5892_17790 [Halotalea alkalilenta]|uniref:Uncharacterized protein n=1 Tax=Halotalea alkalilenta TaxID=376489 RepID=A0A172YIS1_9GAMM|nr:hypothetical protein A5892_17790 [Halotalea alkalilenta]